MDDENIDSKAPDLGILNNWLDFSREASRKQQWEWFVIDQFLKGNHSIRGNAADNTIIVGKRNETINYPINKIFSTFRAVRAFVTRHKPYVAVEPEKQDSAAIDYARRASATLERDNQLNNYRRINKEWVYFGVKYGVGYRQIGYDLEKHCCVRWTVDPNDLFIGSKFGEMEDAPFLIKAVSRTIGYWRQKYGDKAADLAPDNELAASEYKDLALQIKYQGEGVYPSPRISEQTKIGYECWYRIYTKNKLGGTINKCTFVTEKVLDFQETPLDEFPFIPYKADITPNEAVGEGHLKHIIAPQRMLNLLNTQMLEYNHLVNRGRYLLDKNSGFRVINTNEGQIIYRNPGKRVESLNPPSINPMLQWQTNFANEIIEDIGGQHQASLGATPQRVSSGDAIEALQQGDSNNISDLRDNFEDALELEAAWILKMYSLFEKEGVTMHSKLDDKNSESFAIVGQQAYSKTNTKVPGKIYSEDNGDYCDVCAILPDNHVKVSINSQLGETKSAKIDLLFQLVDRGLPLQFALKYLEFPNTSDIMQRIAEEAAGDILKQNLTNPAISGTQNPGEVPPGQVPPPGQPGTDQAPSVAPDNSVLMQQLSQLADQTGAVANG